MTKKNIYLMAGGAVLAALGIAAALNYPPKFGADAAQGAIGQRQVYRDNAVTSGDVAVNPSAAPVANGVNADIKNGVTSGARENMQSEAGHRQPMQSEAGHRQPMQSEAGHRQPMQSEAGPRYTYMNSEGKYGTGAGRENMQSEGRRTGTARENMQSEAGHRQPMQSEAGPRYTYMNSEAQKK